MASSLGSWEVLGSAGTVCIHSILLPDSHVLCIERPKETPYAPNPFTQGRAVTELNLQGEKGVDGKYKMTWELSPYSRNPFCGGTSMLSNGSILIVGGDQKTVPEFDIYDGTKGKRIYNPCQTPDCKKGEWTTLPDMDKGRWYPTVCTLGDGSAMIFSGVTDYLDMNKLGENNNPTYEYWPPKEGAWPRDLELLKWAYPFYLYPNAFTLPSGKVFLFASNKSILIDPKTDEVFNSVPDLIVPDHRPFMYPYAHTMVLLPMTRKNNYQPNVMACGGSLISTQVASNTCWKIELEKAGAKWEQVDNMPHGRVMPDSVILPDGKIAFVNGAGWGVAGGLSAGDAQYAGNPVLSADVFDPEAPAGKQWTVLANATVPRLYHSSAILIQSGQVMTAGSEMQNYVDVEAGKQECFPYGPNACTSPFEYRVELFSPPYMFSDKEKPVIKEAPARLTYDSVFVMTMSTNAIRVNKVNMIRFASSTHSINSDQRLVELEILGKTSDKIYLRAPKTGNLAPPGNWMVFALYDDVPSLSLRINLVNGEVTTVDVPEDAKASANTNAAQSSTFSIAGALFVSAAIAYFLS